MPSTRKPYPSDVSDDDWSLAVAYLTLMREDADQREHPLRELFTGLRYVIRYGIAWRAMPNDLPPWHAVYQQTQRWLAAGCFEALAQDLRAVLRLAAGREAEPTAAIIDSRTLRSTPESGPRAGYDGAKRKKGSKLHLAVDTLGHLLALHVTPARKSSWMSLISRSRLQVLPTTWASTSRGTGSDEAKITASTRPIHSRQRNSGGRSASSTARAISALARRPMLKAR